MPWLLLQGGRCRSSRGDSPRCPTISTGRSPGGATSVSAVGAILDNVADVVFVLGGLTAAAALG